MSRARIEVVDALRAFALVGILQVNIQSFVWGAGDPLGFFVTPPGTLDAAVYLLTATFVSMKFLSIFAFLFGVGFAMQWRSLRRRLPLAEARAAYRRRLGFLLVAGVSHGTLLYFGDILTAYALVGFLLLRHAGQRPAALVAATRRWGLAFILLTVVGMMLVEGLRQALPPADDPANVPAWALERLAAYAQGSYLEQIGPRISDFLSVLGSTALFGVPQVMALFLLGAIAGRLGWLARPERHPQVWRVVGRIGLLALPVAVAGAWINFETMRDSPGDPGAVGTALQSISAPLAGLYVAAFVRWQQAPAGRRLIVWLAPAGRMPLTNYVAQSLLMGLLLSGWGFGLGAELGRTVLALLALVIALVQIAVSRACIARFGEGPLEALWRRATYG